MLIGKKDRVPALLVLENGSVYRGYSFGYSQDAIGEVCFNTSMSGYQEILTDPSYCRQIVTMTYPMIGNYGASSEANESERIQAAGLVVKEYAARPSNHRSEPLAELLKRQKIAAIEGIDTRRLVLEIRRTGAQNGGIFVGRESNPDTIEELLAKVKAEPPMEGRDLVAEVTTDRPYEYPQEYPLRKYISEADNRADSEAGRAEPKRYRLAALDFGIKRSILQLLDQSGFAVTVFPAKTSCSEIENYARAQPEGQQRGAFDCYFLSNGPGDPAPLKQEVDTVKALLREQKPIFGICLGHQLLGLAAGYRSFKLKFGHRGGNQPVKNGRSGQVEITCQNHGFAIQAERATAEMTTAEGTEAAQGKDAGGQAVGPEADPKKGGAMQITHWNLNDQTVEGFEHRKQPILSVQYHPEASPGPHDSRYLFAQFYQLVDQYYSSRQGRDNT